MAKAKTTASVPEISRNIDGFVYFSRNGNTYIRKYTKPAYSNTPEQAAVRAAFSTVVGIWKRNKGMLHAAWEAFALKRKRTGYNAFIGRNATALRQGRPLSLFVGMGIDEEPEEFVAVPGGPGEIVCALAGPGNGYHLTIFTQKMVNGMGEARLKRFDAGAGVSSFTVTGLSPGVEYCVYGVFSDAPFVEATVVSESAGVVATAGV